MMEEYCLNLIFVLFIAFVPSALGFKDLNNSRTFLEYDLHLEHRYGNTWGTNDVTLISSSEFEASAKMLGGKGRYLTDSDGNVGLFIEKGAYIELTTGNDWRFGPSTGLTIEVWARIVGDESEASILSRNGSLSFPSFISSNRVWFWGQFRENGTTGHGFAHWTEENFNSSDLHYYAFTYDMQELNIYVDGILREIVSENRSLVVDSPAVWYLGKSYDEKPPTFSGFIYYFRLTGEPLDQLAILEQYENVTNAPCGPWLNWGPCSKTCHKGVRQRQRVCEEPVLMTPVMEYLTTGMEECMGVVESCRLDEHVIPIFELENETIILMQFHNDTLGLLPHGEILLLADLQNEAILNGSAEITEDHNGNPGIYFDGSSHLAWSVDSKMKLTNNFTIEVWVRPELDGSTAGGSYSLLIGPGISFPSFATSNMVWFTSKFEKLNNSFRWVMIHSGVDINFEYKDKIHYYVVSYNGSALKMYIDGELKSVSQETASLYSEEEGQSSWTLGQGHNSNHFQGMVYGVRVSLFAKDDESIRKHFKAATSGWDEWNSWSQCSATCGSDGVRTRRRTCSGRGAIVLDDVGSCEGPTEENSVCDLQHPCHFVSVSSSYIRVGKDQTISCGMQLSNPIPPVTMSETAAMSECSLHCSHKPSCHGFRMVGNECYPLTEYELHSNDCQLEPKVGSTVFSAREKIYAR